MLKRLFYIAVILALVFAASMASADTIVPLRFTGLGSSQQGVSYNYLGNSGSTTAANFFFELGAPFNTATGGFCVELTQFTCNTFQSYTLSPIADGTAQEAAAYILSLGSTVSGPAAQVAIWELTFDGLGALNSGMTALNTNNFKLTSPNSSTTFYANAAAIYNQAVALVLDPNETFDSSKYVIASNTVPGCQDYIIPNPVPLPGAVLLLSAGLVRLAAYARRRQED